MKQLIYRSEPFGFDSSTLAGILMDARYHNRRDDITGALICRDDFYLQLLEGPDTAIDAAYTRICADSRHCNIHLLVDCTVDARLFPGWDMLHDESPTLTWTPEDITGGAMEAASADALRAVFSRVAAGTAHPAP